MKNSNGFTLIEIIISIAIFSIVSLVLMQLFIVAENVNLESKAKEMALLHTTSYIEDFKADDNLPKKSFEKVIYYDKDWQVTEVDVAYSLIVAVQVDNLPTGDYYLMDLSVFDDQKELLNLSTEHYAQEVFDE